jgi:hypothetical protein
MEKFYIIALISTYVYLKEEYENVQKGVEKNLEEDKDCIVKLIQPLEKFIAIPDKLDFINKSYIELTELCHTNSTGQETEFVKRIKIYSESLSKKEKEEIVNILIYVTDEDRNISEIEKEVILQISNTFELDDNYEELLNKYKKSSLKRPISLNKVLVIFSVMLLSVFGFYKIMMLQQNENSVKIFKENKIVFNKIHFNRFLIYKNKYQLDSAYFKKQVVFYINGKAEVSFDPKDVKYNKISKTVTYVLPKKSPFLVEMDSLTPTIIDEVKPEPMTSHLV